MGTTLSQLKLAAKNTLKNLGVAFISETRTRKTAPLSEVA
jgi:hypothetical protein